MHRDAKALANETTVIKPPAVVGDGGGWLVMVDLIDTGRTAKVPIYAKLLSRAGQYLRYRGEPGHLDLFPWENGQMESMITQRTDG